MPEQPLAAFWTEEVDAKGRRFYSNHIAQTTQWERPAPNEPPIPPEMPPTRRRNVLEVQQASQSPASRNTVNWEWTPRAIFWIAVMVVLLVWIFAVSALADDSWLDDVSLSVVDENILNQCADEDLPTEFYGFCDLCKCSSASTPEVSFMMMQLVATMFASAALLLLSVALFLPAADSCSWAKWFGLGGAFAIAAFAVFQLSALVLMISIDMAESDTAYFFDDPDADYDLGTTFWVAMFGFILAVFDAIILLNFSNSAGEGLFYECIAKLVARNANTDTFVLQPPTPNAGGGRGGELQALP